MTSEASTTSVEAAARVGTAVQSVISGKPETVRLAVTVLLAGGHLLIEDVPGVGKTMLAKSLARALGCSVRRIQFTPDLLPGDVVGVSVFNRETRDFEFKPGAVFANIVLGDEINRASPKTQSALLEAMGERQVTVDGLTHKLSSPFMVIATQNPIEHEGTYPLPESQLDRFLMKLSVGYPARNAELDILDRHAGGDPLVEVGPIVSIRELKSMTLAAQGVHVSTLLRGYIVDIAEATRRHPALMLGMSTRAALALQRVARVQAASVQRPYVSPDDVKALAFRVLGHRLLVNPEAQLQGVTPRQVLEQILESVPVPTNG